MSFKLKILMFLGIFTTIYVAGAGIHYNLNDVDKLSTTGKNTERERERESKIKILFLKFLKFKFFCNIFKFLYKKYFFSHKFLYNS